MSLTKILEEKTRLNQTIAAGPGESLRSRNIKIDMIRRAKQDLESVYEKYRLEARKVAIVMIPTGEFKDDFIKFSAHKDLGCFKVKDLDVYERVCLATHASTYLGQNYSNGLLSLTMQSLERVAHDIGITSYPYPTFKHSYTKPISSNEDYVAQTKSIFQDAFGNDLSAAATLDTASRAAYDMDFDGKYLPIVLDVDGEDIESVVNDFSVYFRFVKMINCSSELKKKDVKQILLDIRETLR